MTKGNDDKQIRLLVQNSSIISVFLCVLLLSNLAQAYELRMGTGSRGSFSHFTGRTLCRIISQETDLKCTTVPAPDATHNLTNLRSGSLDVALIDSRMLHDAFTSQGYFQYLDISYENLRTLLTLYTVPIVLVAREGAGIRTLDEVKGKRFNAGAPLSMKRLAAETIIETKGWTKKSFRLMEELPDTQAQERLAFSSGTVQAMLDIGVHPDPTLEQFLERTKAQLVSMDDADIRRLVADQHAYSKVTIPPRTYSNNVGPVTTFGSQVVLTTSEDLDKETVQFILEVILGSTERLQKAHPALTGIKKEKIRKLNGEIRPHQGVIDYLQKE